MSRVDIRNTYTFVSHDDGSVTAFAEAKIELTAEDMAAASKTAEKFPVGYAVRKALGYDTPPEGSPR